MTWEELLRIPAGTPLAQLNVQVLYAFGDSYHKIAEHAYLFADDEDEEGVVRCYGFSCAASEAAAEWVFAGVWQPEDVRAKPPGVLLPTPMGTSHRAVVEYGKRSAPGRFREKAGGPSMVSFGDYSFYYRKAIPAETDEPIAIGVDRSPDKRFRA